MTYSPEATLKHGAALVDAYRLGFQAGWNSGNTKDLWSWRDKRTQNTIKCGKDVDALLVPFLFFLGESGVDVFKLFLFFLITKVRSIVHSFPKWKCTNKQKEDKLKLHPSLSPLRCSHVNIYPFKLCFFLSFNLLPLWGTEVLPKSSDKVGLRGGGNRWFFSACRNWNKGKRGLTSWNAFFYTSLLRDHSNNPAIKLPWSLKWKPS